MPPLPASEMVYFSVLVVWNGYIIIVEMIYELTAGTTDDGFSGVGASFIVLKWDFPRRLLWEKRIDQIHNKGGRREKMSFKSCERLDASRIFPFGILCRLDISISRMAVREGYLYPRQRCFVLRV